MKRCIVEGCGREAHSKGMCNKHYLHNRRYGTPYTHTTEYGLLKAYKKEYDSYRAMKNRCLCPTDSNYPRWGGRGIKICDRWLGGDGFKHFLKDMGPRPTKKTKTGHYEYTLDRVDPNGDYCPENCRWANRHTQIGNTRKAIEHGLQGIYYRKDRNDSRPWCANFKYGDVRLTKCFYTKEAAIQQRIIWENEYLSSCKEDKDTVK